MKARLVLIFFSKLDCSQTETKHKSNTTRRGGGGGGGADLRIYGVFIFYGSVNDILVFISQLKDLLITFLQKDLPT